MPAGAGADEFGHRLIAVSIESCHVRFLIDHRFAPVAAVSNRLKTRMRQAFRGLRTWTAGYDSRYCFQEQEVRHRAGYINRHKGARRLPAPLGVVDVAG